MSAHNFQKSSPRLLIWMSAPRLLGLRNSKTMIELTKTFGKSPLVKRISLATTVPAELILCWHLMTKTVQVVVV